jgi:hypothetical protein
MGLSLGQDLRKGAPLGTGVLQCVFRKVPRLRSSADNFNDDVAIRSRQRDNKERRSGLANRAAEALV